MLILILLIKSYIFHFSKKILEKIYFDSPHYYTAVVSFFCTKIRITQQNLNKNQNILTYRSVAQAGLNDEKNWMDCPFKYLTLL